MNSSVELDMFYAIMQGTDSFCHYCRNISINVFFFSHLINKLTCLIFADALSLWLCGRFDNDEVGVC